MSGTVSVLVPCRAGSQRIPRKNVVPLPGYPGGLTELKLRQLARAERVSDVVVSTDDPEVIAIGEAARAYMPDRIRLHVVERPEEFARSEALDVFVGYVPTIMPPGPVAWLHVTSPFFDGDGVDRAAKAYFDGLEDGGFDSLMGVTRHQTFFWSDDGCISHDRAVAKWPQTQTLPPLYEVNSSIFIIDRDEMARRVDRIGDAPVMHAVTRWEAFDIDWPEDFAFLEHLLTHGGVPGVTLPAGEE